jgi:hypothetical protein
MSLLEDINLLVLDVNRDIQAMVFFMRMPPRIDTNEKFLDLAKTATTDFRALQAKTAEASELYPDADTSFMTLELAIEALQAFLVTSIKQIRAALNSWMESQQTQAPGPSLDFLPSITAEMFSLVENVVSSTKSIKKIISGESLAPPQIQSASAFEERPDVDVHDELAVEILLADPSSTHLNHFLGNETPSQSSSSSTLPTEEKKGVQIGNFDVMLADYEREQRKEARRAERRANGQGVRKREVTTRPSIEIDQDTIESIVLHLSTLTAFFFNESNHFGERQGSLETVLMTDLTGSSETAVKASETALHLQTASIDMESLLNHHHQTTLAKLTNLHMKDIFVAMKDVMKEAPNVRWDSLRTLDVAIKDYANTIKDVVNLSSPEVIEVEEENEDEIDEESSSEEEVWAPIKPQRLLTREEEMMIALDGFTDALDAIEVGPPSREGSRSDLSPSSSNSPSHRPSLGELPVSKSPAVPNNPLSYTSSSLESPRSAATGDAPKENKAPRYQESRVTLQFPQVRPRASASSFSSASDAVSKEEKEEKKSRPSLAPTKSSSSIEQTYEIADESIRQADPVKVIDRWTGMQAKAEERKVVTQDGSIESADRESTDWESSKVKAALKFMSKKVDNFRKKASGGGGSGNTAGNRDSVRLTQSSSSLFSSSPAGKRRSMVPVGNTATPSSSTSLSTSSSPTLPSNMARRSVQLSGLTQTDKRIFLFEEPDDETTLRISPETDAVVAGTIEKLVQRLTHDSMPNPDFVLSFLTTHKCFTTSAELLELLCLRWDTAAPPDTEPAVFETNRLPSIRLRVYNVLKTWMEKFWNDLNDPVLIDRLKVFTAAMYHGGLSSASQTLTKIIQKNLGNEGPLPQSLPEPPPVFDFVRRSRREPPIIVPNPPNLPSPVVLNLNPSLQSPKLSRPLSILDFHPTELARQVSVMEFELWKQVKNIELLDVAWTRKDKETRAPNVLNMIRFSNHISQWLVTEILTPDDPLERSVVLNRCLWMVKSLIEFRNFNGAMECLSAFHSSPIYRLKSTWNLLPASTWAIYDSLERLMSPDANFKTYRNEYDRSVPPYTPYLGTHLSDLLFLEEKLPRFIEGTSLINYTKMEKMAHFIQTLELSQQMPYSFTPVPLIVSYIKDFVPLSEKDAYNRSLQVEARKAKARPNSSAFNRQTVDSSVSATAQNDFAMAKESPPSSSGSTGH